MCRLKKQIYTAKRKIRNLFVNSVKNITKHQANKLILKNQETGASVALALSRGFLLRLLSLHVEYEAVVKLGV